VSYSGRGRLERLSDGGPVFCRIFAMKGFTVEAIVPKNCEFRNYETALSQALSEVFVQKNGPCLTPFFR
jgi:hypothetical protein